MMMDGFIFESHMTCDKDFCQMSTDFYRVTPVKILQLSSEINLHIYLRLLHKMLYVHTLFPEDEY